MEFDIFKLVDAGAVIFLAVIVVGWKRADDQRYQRNLEAMFARMDELVCQFAEAIRANTAAFQIVADALKLEQQLEKLRDEIGKRDTGKREGPKPSSE